MQEQLDLVYRFVLHMTGEHHTTEDIVAQTFEKAWNSWDRYNPSRAQPQTWLCQIARNTCLDHWRQQKRRQEELGAQAKEAGSAAPEPLFEGFSLPLAAALRTLSSEERQLVALRIVLEFSTRETAQVLNISESSCSSQLHRTLDRLRQEVDRHEQN